MIVGTAGHIDHGKTALVKALTGIDTDRLKEEKARGITIDLGFAYWPQDNGDVIGFVDVPGHERFVHTMVAGASGIDFVILVVAVDDAVKPQTLEHLAIIDILGIEQGVVVLSKADLAGEGRRVEAMAQIRYALADTVLEECPIIPVSVVTGEGIEVLKQHLHSAASARRERDRAGLFRLSVDRSFVLSGTGTVVTGTVLSGSVSVGDHVVVSPFGRTARVRSIHAQNRAAEQGVAGQRCALNLTGESISKDSVTRGDMVLAPELHAPTDRIDASLRILPSEKKPVGQWFPVRLHHAAVEVGARIVLLQDEPIQPGERSMVQLVLDRPIAATAHDRFVIRDTSAQRTIGGGFFIDLRAPARYRRREERRAQISALAQADPSLAMKALASVQPCYFDLVTFARDRAMALGVVTGIADRLDFVRLAAGSALLALARERWLAFEAGLTNILDTFHKENQNLQGLGFERLRLQCEPRLSATAFRAALQSLVADGRIRVDGSWVRLPGHEVRLDDREEGTWQAIQPLLSGEERFRPPRVRDIADAMDMPENEIRRLCKLLSRLGQVDEVAHDHFFLRSTVAEMVDIAQALALHAADGQFTAAQFRDCVQNGRKVAIQILEFFDRHGVTLRRGDLRRINPHRLDLFRAIPPFDKAHGGEASPVGRPDFKSGWGREPVLARKIHGGLAGVAQAPEMT
ncbi:selenocysteine-specific translation elongation factor [Microvirga calopogonii]|uniref:selenocysteine-specific translation elongation factor n=1 Tax=Microvirga calopogonii TaxID=2078013 RepID=UPI000E0CCF88|nr:selenocysteine-specific translation elongation factor [Microvirga calopogonii]